jgi:hypothetical protein
MKLDGGTIAALVVAGTGAFTFILQWRAGAGRSRIYNRLGQLLELRGKIPDGLTTVRDRLDAEITRVSSQLGAQPTQEGIQQRRPQTHYTKPYDPATTGPPAAKIGLLNYVSWLPALNGLVYVTFFSFVFLVALGPGWWVWIGFAVVGLAITVDTGINAVRAKWQASVQAQAANVGRRRMSAVPERTEGGTPGPSGDVDAAGPAGTPLPRREGLDSGTEPNRAGAQVVDRGGEL